MAASSRLFRFQYWIVAVSSVLALGVQSSLAGGSHGGGGGHAGFAGSHMGSGYTGYGVSGYSHTNHSYSGGFFGGYGVYGGFGGFGGYAVGPYLYGPSLVGISPGGFSPFLAPVFPQGNFPFAGNFGNGGGLNLPMPPRAFADPNLPQPRRTNPARAKEQVEIGDRSFRGHNIKRAEDKYNLAVKADPTSPTPHVHLAQVSVARGRYSAAADHLRNAVTVAQDGAWLTNAPDIQAIFGEPADFAKQLAKLESHLQANPNDRDAWFVLGAETYLSGRSRQAYDVFQRLTDRRPDEALTAFLDASRPRPADAN